MDNSQPSTPIAIRHAEPDDYKALHRILSGPNAVWGTLQLPYSSPERWRARLATQSDDIVNLVACVDGDVVGQLGIHLFPQRPRRRHVGQIGMAVRDDWHGKGVGTALLKAAIDLADNWLQLTRLELEVYTDNTAAVALYKKLGFAIEGTLVHYAFRNGEYVDAHIMARLRPV
jgi:putative acetyltransferase